MSSFQIPTGGSLIRESDWVEIEQIAASTPPKWFKDFSSANPIGGLHLNFPNGSLPGFSGDARCTIHSAAYYKMMITHHYLWGRSSPTSGWARGWFPIGTAEDGDYWITPSDGDSTAVHYFCDSAFDPQALRFGDPIADFDTLLNAAEITPIDNEWDFAGRPNMGEQGVDLNT
jgi:hypothetical protein